MKSICVCPNCGVSTETISPMKFGDIVSYKCAICDAALDLTHTPNAGLIVKVCGIEHMDISNSQYQESFDAIDEAFDFDSIKDTQYSYIDHLKQQLEVSISEQDFERCAVLREQIKQLQQ